MKKILITGASSGIGEAAARELHARGHFVYLTARRTDRLELIRDQLGHERCGFSALDVRDAGQVSQVIHTAQSAMGGIDVLINNAGLGYFDPVAEGKLTDWLDMVNTNVNGLLSCLHAALPHLIEARGHVINVGSVASHLVFPNSGIYCATKHAVFAISESLRIELGDKIRVTTISPGAVNTPFILQTTNERLISELKPGFDSGLSPASVALQMAWVIESPADTMISEIIIRPDKSRKKT